MATSPYWEQFQSRFRAAARKLKYLAGCFSSPRRSGRGHYLTPLTSPHLQWGSKATAAVGGDRCVQRPIKKKNTTAFPFSECNTRISESAAAEALSWLHGQKQHNRNLVSIMDDSLHMLQTAKIKIRPPTLSGRVSDRSGNHFHVCFRSARESTAHRGHASTHLSLGIWWFGLWWQRMLRPNSLRAVCWILRRWISREVWRSL